MRRTQTIIVTTTTIQIMMMMMMMMIRQHIYVHRLAEISTLSNETILFFSLNGALVSLL